LIDFHHIKIRKSRVHSCAGKKIKKQVGYGHCLMNASEPNPERLKPQLDKMPESGTKRPVEAGSSLYDAGYVNAMSHFYRGELGRIMVWRQRLDMTTQWSIISTTSIVTVAFSARDVPHIIFFFNLIVVAVLLWIEARRYRFYDAFRARVRMLEAHFLVPMVMQDKRMLQGEWKKLVCEDLILPAFKISRMEAIGQRMRRNYAFIFILILSAWILKIFIHSPEDAHVRSFRSFYSNLAVGSLPSWIVAFVMGLTFLVVIGMTVYFSRNCSGEVSEFGNNRNQWKL